MPKTAVYKNSNPILRKHKVRMTKQGPMSAPAGYFICTKKFYESQLGSFISLHTRKFSDHLLQMLPDHIHGVCVSAAVNF